MLTYAEVLSRHSSQAGIPGGAVVALMLDVMGKNAKLRKSAHESLLKVSAALRYSVCLL